MKKLLSILLILVMCLGMLPSAAFAAEKETLPDWYFLFAVFKKLDSDVTDGYYKTKHVTYSMPQEEVDLIRDLAVEFEEYMNSVGVMRAHVEVVEIDATVTELEKADTGISLFLPKQAAPFLEDKVDLDRYDHVFCILDFTVWTGYAGMTYSPSFENGAGMSHIHPQDWKHLQDSYRSYTDKNLWHIGTYVHEFLHFGERMTKKWGEEYHLHNIIDNFYPSEDQRQTCFTDIILNRAQGTDGTGICPVVWQYPPHVLRTMKELNIPSGTTSIGEWAFSNNTMLTKATIPGTVTAVGGAAFYDCTGLTEVNILPGVAEIGSFAFRGCSSLTRVSIPASVASIGEVGFGNAGSIKDVYYSGSEAQWKAIQISTNNSVLSRATIHYNRLMADVKTDDWFAAPVVWALEGGITAGTGDGNFSPGATCAQAQIVTFLWRANGSPEPAGAASGSEYYAKAVQWAREQSLIDGTFSANAPCTRAMAVTYLWKLAGSPSAKASGFADVPAGAEYAGAVAWAVEKGVTAGTSADAFSPDSTCTRGQIVTFLYRALAK
ncbi:MAG: leucine-rich repeat protein [Clostridiaceae bacterium]|nr:leucine-rich repeat protein [Clostridiaceae bacterium]